MAQGTRDEQNGYGEEDMGRQVTLDRIPIGKDSHLLEKWLSRLLSLLSHSLRLY